MVDAWARISMNQMGGIFRIDEYDPVTDSVKVEHIGFNTRGEAESYCEEVNNPDGGNIQ